MPIKIIANLIREDLREVPVVERDRRLDPLGLQSSYEILVVLDALGVLLARPAGNDSRPRDGESVQGGQIRFYDSATTDLRCIQCHVNLKTLEAQRLLSL